MGAKSAEAPSGASAVRVYDTGRPIEEIKRYCEANKYKGGQPTKWREVHGDNVHPTILEAEEPLTRHSRSHGHPITSKLMVCLSGMLVLAQECEGCGGWRFAKVEQTSKPCMRPLSVALREAGMRLVNASSSWIRDWLDERLARDAGEVEVQDVHAAALR